MIVVTGATGHIGNVLVRQLLSMGEKVRVLVPPFEDLKPLDGLDVEIFRGDVLDIQDLEKAFQGAKVVFHLAGVISITSKKRNLMYKVNVEGARNVAKVCRKLGIKRLVHTSSVHALREVKPGSIIDENVPFDPENVRGHYARSKALGSLAVLEEVKKGLDAVIICPTGVIGPYDYRLSEMGRVILKCARNKLKMCIKGRFDFVDVRDVVRGAVLAAEKGRKGEVYILGGSSVWIQDLLITVQKIVGMPPKVLIMPIFLAKVAAAFAVLLSRFPGYEPLLTPYSIHTLTLNYMFSYAKAFKELGYTPRYTLKHSIKDTIDWFMHNDLLSPPKCTNSKTVEDF
ncbi:MAG: SDR family oxidoreductase [Thermotogae bacterium]|nr:SDR family oxidoreductase [Thermotogota bacterium]